MAPTGQLSWQIMHLLHLLSIAWGSLGVSTNMFLINAGRNMSPLWILTGFLNSVLVFSIVSPRIWIFSTSAVPRPLSCAILSIGMSSGLKPINVLATTSRATKSWLARMTLLSFGLPILGPRPSIPTMPSIIARWPGTAEKISIKASANSSALLPVMPWILDLCPPGMAPYMFLIAPVNRVRAWVLSLGSDMTTSASIRGFAT